MGLFCLACLVCFVCLIWIKKFKKGRWNFVLVQIFLITQIVLSGMHGVHFVFYLMMENSCPRQYLFWACSNFLLAIETAAVCANILELVWLGTHCVHFLFYFMLEHSRSLSKISCNLMADWFVRHARCAMSVLWLKKQKMLKAVGIFCVLQIFLITWIVLSGTHVFTFCFIFDGNFLPKAVLILSLSK